VIKDVIGHARLTQLLGMLFHQLLEASERHMRSLYTGLGTEDSYSFIN
jgi:hypothetical protein